MVDKEKDKQILNYIAPNGKLISQRCLKVVIEKQGFYDYLKQRYSDLSSKESEGSSFLKEIIYRLFNHIEERPVCKICGSLLTFKEGKYPTYCSQKCTNSDPEVLNKNRIGVSKALKEAYQERKEEITAKRAGTLKEKYGENVSSPWKLQSVKDKIKETTMKNHGVQNAFNIKEVRDKTIESQRQKAIERLKDIVGYDKDIDWPDTGLPMTERIIVIHDYCPIHGDARIPMSVLNNRIKSGKFDSVENLFCLQCHPMRNKEI